MTALDDDALIAAVDLIGRTGSREFEVGYTGGPDEGERPEQFTFGRTTHRAAPEDDEGTPADRVTWWASAYYRGHRVITEGHASPDVAAEALARQLLDSGQCRRCGGLVTLTDAPAPPVGRVLVDGTRITAAEAAAVGHCRWTRVGRRWEPGCGRPEPEQPAPARPNRAARRAAARKTATREGNRS